MLGSKISSLWISYANVTRPGVERIDDESNVTITDRNKVTRLTFYNFFFTFKVFSNIAQYQLSFQQKPNVQGNVTLFMMVLILYILRRILKSQALLNRKIEKDPVPCERLDQIRVSIDNTWKKPTREFYVTPFMLWKNIMFSNQNNVRCIKSKQYP